MTKRVRLCKQFPEYYQLATRVCHDWGLQWQRLTSSMIHPSGSVKIQHRHNLPQGSRVHKRDYWSWERVDLMLAVCLSLERRRGKIRRVPEIVPGLVWKHLNWNYSSRLIRSKNNLCTRFQVISDEGRIDCDHVENITECNVKSGNEEEDDSWYLVTLNKKLGDDSVCADEKPGNAFTRHQRLRVFLFWQQRCETVERALLNGATDCHETYSRQIHRVCGLSWEYVPSD